jgi:hypothetical protein
VKIRLPKENYKIIKSLKSFSARVEEKKSSKKENAEVSFTETKITSFKNMGWAEQLQEPNS